MELKDSDLRKRKVMTSDGKEVGMGAGIEFDTTSLKVQAVFVKIHSEVSKELGGKKPLFSKAELRVPIERISGIGDAIILTWSAAELPLK
jgi:sporulation protein YlmC with PRC-barrel domain